MENITYLLLLTLVIFVTSIDPNEEEIKETGRIFPVPIIFPFLPPYQGVDFLANWRTLATLHNAVFTLLKSTITVSLRIISAIQLNILIIHIMSHLCRAHKSTNISSLINKTW